MSLFDFELPHVQGIVLDPAKQVSGLGSSAPSTGLPAGSIWYDSTGTMQMIVPSGQTGFSSAFATNQTAVTNTNPITAAVALMTQVFPAGSLNVVGRTIEIFAAGEYTTDGGTGRTVAFSAVLSDGTESNTLFSVTTGATTASQTGFAWQFELKSVIATTGTEANILSHGSFSILLGGSAQAASTRYLDVNTAATADTDLTLSNTLTIGQFYGGSNVGNTFTQDMMIVKISN